MADGVPDGVADGVPGGAEDREELRRELGELVESVRAFIEWQGEVGTAGFPRRPPGELPSAPFALPPVEPSPAGLAIEPGPSPEAALPAAEALEVAPPAAEALEVALPAAEPPEAMPAEESPEAAPPHAAVIPLRREPSRDREEARVRLVSLEGEVRGCVTCRLHERRQQTVFSRGTGASGLCFVGEGPGADEDAQGLPFVGAAGQLLDRMIVGMGLTREEVYVCNVVKCRPPDNRKPQPDEMEACRPYLEEQLDLVDPEVIVALGATAVQGLLGTTDGITRLRGKWRLYRGRIAVMPTFHPAYLLRTPNARRDVWNDLKEVLRHLGREIPGRPS